MLIRNPQENQVARKVAPDVTYCAQCGHELRFPRIQLLNMHEPTGVFSVFHPECAAKVAASIATDLHKLLKSIIL